MTHTVEKIGGTSIADTASVLDNVLIGGRAGAALYNRVFVVSAYAGMTNLLLEHKKTGVPGVYGLFTSGKNSWAWSDALSELADAMIAKNEQIFARESDREIANGFVRDRVEGVRNCLIDLQRLCSYGPFRLADHLATVREMLAALGEAHSAFNTALLLRGRGVDAAFVDLTGWRDERALSLEERIREAFSKLDLACTLPIVTGYAACSDGMARTYDRGYTEVTFSRVAVLTGAHEAIIHKEFHLSSADPKLVGAERVRKIGRTNYDVADQLSNMGMEAVHPQAAKGLRQANIPLRVKNTYEPDDAGTLIEAGFVSSAPKAEIVTGLKHVFALELFEQDMVGVKGYDASILEALTRHRVRIVAKCSNANTITHFVECSPKALNRTVSDLESIHESAEVTVREVAIVSVIGSDLSVPGLVAQAAAALEGAGVRLLGMHQPSRNVDLQCVVDVKDFDAAVDALHARLVEQAEPAELRSAA